MNVGFCDPETAPPASHGRYSLRRFKTVSFLKANTGDDGTYLLTIHSLPLIKCVKDCKLLPAALRANI